ncbi:hypothetical protein JHW43_002818 [Diplocarpon mali]|nr:hypothetical protein JHW43_002818 [Diplocarpon mali]
MFARASRRIFSPSTQHIVRVLPVLAPGTGFRIELLAAPWCHQSPVSSLQSPVSSLQSPVSSLQSPVSSLQSPKADVRASPPWSLEVARATQQDERPTGGISLSTTQR